MWKDPIVEEVRAARDAFAKRFGYDIHKIVADLLKKQEARAAGASRTKKKPVKALAAKRKTSTTKRRKAA